MQIIVAFSSRNDSISFCDLVRKKGFPATLINTPRELSIGCGLSVSIEDRHIIDIRKQLLILTPHYRSYMGTFKVNKVGSRSSVIKIHP